MSEETGALLEVWGERTSHIRPPRWEWSRLPDAALAALVGGGVPHYGASSVSDGPASATRRQRVYLPGWFHVLITCATEGVDAAAWARHVSQFDTDRVVETLAFLGCDPDELLEMHTVYDALYEACGESAVDRAIWTFVGASRVDPQPGT